MKLLNYASWKNAALNAEKTAKETFIDGIAEKNLPVINLKKYI